MDSQLNDPKNFGLPLEKVGTQGEKELGPQASARSKKPLYDIRQR